MCADRPALLRAAARVKRLLVPRPPAGDRPCQPVPVACPDVPGLICHRSAPGSTPLGGPPVIVFGSAAKQAAGGAAEDLPFLASLARVGRPWVNFTDATGSWYSAPAMVEAILAGIRAIMAETGSRQVDTIGFSMGGFGALAFAERVAVRRALAYAPRFSPDPAIVRDPRRRQHLAALSGRFPMPSVAAGLAGIADAVVIHGLHPLDLRHVMRFPAAPGLRHWIVETPRHNVPAHLKDQKCFVPLTAAILDGDRAGADALLRQAGAQPLAEIRDRLQAAPPATGDAPSRHAIHQF